MSRPKTKKIEFANDSKAKAPRVKLNKHQHENRPPKVTTFLTHKATKQKPKVNSLPKHPKK